MSRMRSRKKFKKFKMRNNVFSEVRGMFYVRLARNNVGNKRYVCSMQCYALLYAECRRYTHDDTNFYFHHILKKNSNLAISD